MIHSWTFTKSITPILFCSIILSQVFYKTNCIRCHFIARKWHEMHAMAWIRETSNQNEHRVRRATFSKSAAVIWKNITNKIPSVKATYILYLKDHFYVWEGPFYHLLLYEPTWRYLSNVASSCILNAVIKTVLLNWSGGVNPRLSLKVVWTETHITFRQLPCHSPITSCDLPVIME